MIEQIVRWQAKHQSGHQGFIIYAHTTSAPLVFCLVVQCTLPLSYDMVWSVALLATSRSRLPDLHPPMSGLHRTFSTFMLAGEKYVILVGGVSW